MTTALLHPSARLVCTRRLADITSLISESSVFEGSFHSRHDLGLKVDGLLRGSVRFEQGGTVHVGATGVVDHALIEADHVFIEGRVQGEVIARKTLEVSGSATITGQVLYDALVDIHPRARLRGSVAFRGPLDAPGEQSAEQSTTARLVAAGD